jgi:type I restriction enzyme, S subunit
MNWPSVHLNEIAKIDRDGVNPAEIADGTLYVGLEHIESGGRLLNVRPVANGELASTKFRFTRKHVL